MVQAGRIRGGSAGGRVLEWSCLNTAYHRDREMPTRLGLPSIGVWCSTQTFGTAPFSEVRGFLSGIEDLGYEMLWIPESFGREVMAHAALLLTHSDRLVIGTGIANIWARDAIAMENGAKTMAEAFPGRFVLGIGISHVPNVAARGHTYRTPMEITRTYLEDMNSARWDGPAPEQPAIRLLAALGPKMIALSGELTDGAHPFLVTPEHTRLARQVLGLEPLLAPEQSVLISNDPYRARRAGREHLAHYLDRSSYRRSFLRQGFTEEDVSNGGSDRLVDAIVAHGDADAVASRVREHLDAGADHVAVQVVATNLAATLKNLEELAPRLLGTRT
jgi:probable F420-dependent oxidoreductase